MLMISVWKGLSGLTRTDDRHIAFMVRYSCEVLEMSRVLIAMS